MEEDGRTRGQKRALVPPRNPKKADHKLSPNPWSSYKIKEKQKTSLKNCDKLGRPTAQDNDIVLNLPEPFPRIHR